MTEPTWELVEGFLRDLGQGTQRKRARAIERAPLAAIREAATGHPDASLRRWMLAFLDHYDNDASMATFAEALHDPDEHVRTAALHSLACDACKQDELCVADVVRSLIDVLLHDPLADLRIRSLQQLLYLAARDDRVLPAVRRCSVHDIDPVVRHAAAEALAGRFVLPAKRYDRSRVRHAGTRARR